jgi:hypothetical protein
LISNGVFMLRPYSFYSMDEGGARLYNVLSPEIQLKEARSGDDIIKMHREIVSHMSRDREGYYKWALQGNVAKSYSLEIERLLSDMERSPPGTLYIGGYMFEISLCGAEVGPSKLVPLVDPIYVVLPEGPHEIPDDTIRKVLGGERRVQIYRCPVPTLRTLNYRGVVVEGPVEPTSEDRRTAEKFINLLQPTSTIINDAVISRHKKVGIPKYHQYGGSNNLQIDIPYFFGISPDLLTAFAGKKRLVETVYNCRTFVHLVELFNDMVILVG